MIQSVLQIINAVNKSEMMQQAVNRMPLPTLFDKMQPGQQLQATVLNPDINGQALLRIGNEKFLVDTTLQLKAGQHINVELVSKQATSIELKLLDMPRPENIRAQFLKMTLPAQESLTALLKNLSENIVKITGQQIDTKTSQAIQALATRILQQAPSAKDIANPQVIQKALSASGLFLETKLLNGQTPANDLKADLLKIAHQLRESISQKLNRDAGGRFSNLQTNNPSPVDTRAAANRFQQTANLQTPNTSASSNPGTPPVSTSVSTSANMASAKPTQTSLQSPVKTTNATTPVNTVDGRAQLAPREARRTDSTAGNAAGNIDSAKPGVQQTATNPQAVSEIKGATEKSSMTATQAAQKAMMLAQAGQKRLVQSMSSNLLNNPAFRQALDQLPNNEFNLLLKQLLFKKNIAPESQNQLLNTVLRNTAMGQMLKAVENSLARLHTQQLASVPQEDSTRQVWQLEIPVRDQKDLHSIAMRIEQDDANADSAKDGSTWTVSLNLDLEETGHIHSKIRLTRDVVSTHFWTETTDTVQKITQHMPRLTDAMEKLGLSVNHMTASLGKPPDPVDISHIRDSLLDEKA